MERPTAAGGKGYNVHPQQAELKGEEQAKVKVSLELKLKGS